MLAIFSNVLYDIYMFVYLNNTATFKMGSLVDFGFILTVVTI